VLPAIANLAAEVQANELGTLMYLVHTPYSDATHPSIPPTNTGEIVFFEMYADLAAFDTHVSGPYFQRFLADYGGMFVQHNEQPFVTCEFLSPNSGFVRPTRTAP